MTEAQRIALDMLVTAMRQGRFPVGWSEHQIMDVGDVVRDVHDGFSGSAVETVDAVEDVLISFGALTAADRGRVDVVPLLEVLLPPS